MKKKTQSDLSQKLEQKRKKINLLDQKLLSLLNHRLGIALKIGKIKKEMGEKSYDPKRENEVLEKLKRRNKGPLKEEDLKKIFRTIMKVCRDSQTC